MERRSWLAAVGVLVAALVATEVAEGLAVPSGLALATKYVFVARGVVIGLLVMVTAVFLVERRLARVELSLEVERRLEAMFAQFVDGLPVAAFVVNAQGEPLYANADAKRLLGKGVEPVRAGELAATYQAYVAGTERLYPLEHMPLTRALRGERGATATDMELHVGGRRRRLEVWANPILDEEGRVRYAIAAFVERPRRKVAA